MDFNVRGFGTFAETRTDTDLAQFTRDNQPSGAREAFSDKVDSNLGVQASAQVFPWLSATVQVLTKQQRFSRTFSADAPWAYVKVDPIQNLSFKLGRMLMPLFAVSDSRDIGYANTWMRPPSEVYSLANIEKLDGGQATYSMPVGFAQVSATGFVGNSSVEGPPIAGKLQVYRVRGGELRAETEWVTLRAGYTSGEVNLAPLHSPNDEYSFYGAGALVDHDNIVAQAEYVRRRSSTSSAAVDSNGWYVLGGYRFGKFVPFASFANTTKSKGPTFFTLSGDQSTTSLGVRWDAFKSADLKFQYDRVDPKGTQGISFTGIQPGFGHDKVNVFTLGVDFVF